MSLKDKYSEFKDRFARFKERNRVTSLLLNKYAIVTLVFVVWILFFDNNNVGVWIKARRMLRAQQRQIEFYQNEISAKENRMDHLRSRKDSLETFAREEYGFHEEGEDVYIVK